MIVDRALYVDGRRADDDVDLATLIARGRDDPHAFVWVGLHEPSDDEFDDVRTAFDLHPLAVEDAIHAHQRPKLERYGDSLFVVLKTARYDDPAETVEIGEIMLFLGEGFVVTVRHGDISPLSEVRAQLEREPEELTQGPGAILHAVADRVVDDYAQVLDGLDNDIDEIEAEVFSPGRHNHAERIYRLKRQVQAFRRAVFPLGDAVQRLATEPLVHVDTDLHEYFRDVHDHVVRGAEHLSTLDELLNSALSANLAQIGIRQNEDMRRISAWVAIVAIPTAIAAIYGMNFEHMPELEWRYGYFVVLGAMATLCVVLYRLFKRTGWL